jgi:hypothetical protein
MLWQQREFIAAAFIPVVFGDSWSQVMGIFVSTVPSLLNVSSALWRPVPSCPHCARVSVAAAPCSGRGSLDQCLQSYIPS